MEEKLANGLRDLEVLRAEASEQLRQFGSQQTSMPRRCLMIWNPTRIWCHTVTRVQVSGAPDVNVQSVQESSRSKKARRQLGGISHRSARPSKVDVSAH